MVFGRKTQKSVIIFDMVLGKEAILLKEALAQFVSCELCEICKNTFLTEHLRVIASVGTPLIDALCQL